MFEVRSGKPGEQDPWKQLEAIGWDTRRGLELGLGKIADVRAVDIYDGSRILRKATKESATIRAATSDESEYSFDPRIFKLSRTFSVEDTLDSALSMVNVKEHRTIGREEVRGASTWHVVGSWRPEDPKRTGFVDFHYWIEDIAPFRVHRFEYWGGLDRTVHSTERTEMHFEGECPFPALTEQYSSSTGSESKVIWRVEKAHLKKKPDPSIFTLAGLGLELGEEVVDRPGKQSAGFWDGKGLVKSPSEIVKPLPRPPDAPPYDWLSILLVAVALAGAVAMTWYYLRQRSREAGP
jgi:hypothetical protein